MTTGLLITIGGFLFIIITGAIYARSGMWKAFKNQDKFIAMQQAEIRTAGEIIAEQKERLDEQAVWLVDLEWELAERARTHKEKIKRLTRKRDKKGRYTK